MKNTIKMITVISLMSIMCSWSTGAIAADQWHQEQQREHGFFHSLWGKIKTIMPRRNTNANHHVTAVIGVRGAETTETALTPHWEQDLASDPVFQSDMKSFETAGSLCEKGDVSEGTRELIGLVETSSFQSIQSNGLLALAACYDQQGEQKKSLSYLKSFVKKYPKHPMTKDVQAFIASVK
ncbi:MAG: tetratricopeptide repeat protein [Mariprofundaceae bacterium]|nr:tetratricopeptide repeat protein [Mariprofundaceae bacterium]